MATVHNRHDRVLIDGRWEPTDAGIPVTDLAEGGEVGTAAAATPEQARAALAAADEACARLRETTAVERAAWMEQIAAGVEARSGDLVETIVREAGKPVSAARSEVAATVERFRRAADEARARDGEFVEGSTAGHEGWQAIVKPRPLGVVLCITPYNYPLATTALQVAPALATGNAVVHKPATATPLSGALLAAVVGDADVPAGGYNFVPGRSDEIGDLLAGDARVDAVAMTGSAGAGERVARRSGLARLQMELGGNAPALVFPDADLDAAAAAVTSGAFKYAGQRCSAVSRVLVHEAVHDDLADRVEARAATWRTGDLFDEDTAVGPLISGSQADYVESLIADAVERGAALAAGGERDGRRVEPAVLTDVPVDARVVTEEQFGPVCPLVPVADEAAALSVANAGDLGLDACVFTADYDRAMRLADAVDAGSVRINGAPSHGLGDVPFGGVGASGIGRQGLGYTADAFTTTKSIVL